jgi:hypothetical protein
MKARILIMTVMLAVTFPLIACDDDIVAPEPAVLCTSGLCAEAGEARDGCVDLITLCVADEPEANRDACVAAGLLICNPV